MKIVLSMFSAISDGMVTEVGSARKTEVYVVVD